MPPATRFSAFAGTVATFTDDDPNGVAGDYTATINWGDGTTSTGVVTAGAAGGFAATGSHSFAEGRFTIITTLTDAGGASAFASTPLTVDVTPPVTTATVTGTLGNNGWWKGGSPTVLTLAATDNLSGVAATFFTVNGGSAQVYTGPITLTDGRYTIQYWSVDVAGNVETAHTILIKVDHRPPTVTITGVANGARYMLGTALNPNFTATDDLSGVAISMGVLTRPGTASGAGAYTFTASATDNAGNTTTAAAHYVVDYFFVSLQLLTPGLSVKLGMNLNLRFQLFSTDGTPSRNAVAILLLDGSPANPAGTFNTGDLFRYDPMSQSYMYRMSTTGLSTGIHMLTIVLDDGTRREVGIAVGAPAPPSLQLSAPITTTGSVETISGHGYAPGSHVTVSMNGIIVATVTASSTGAFTVTVPIPATAPLGMCSFTAGGVAPGGSRLVETAWVTLVG
jgi:hypothetical protein